MPKLMQRYHEDRASGMRTILGGIDGRIDALKTLLEGEDHSIASRAGRMLLEARLEALENVRSDVQLEISKEMRYAS